MLAAEGANDWLNVKLGLKSQFDVVVLRETKSFASHPRFRELARGKSSSEVRMMASSLTSAGLQYLDLASLQEWARLKLVLATGSPDLCAEMWTGRYATGSLKRELAKVPLADAQSWARLSARAGTLALEGGAPPGPGADAIPKRLKLLLQYAPEEDRNQFVDDLRSRQLSNERACTLMKFVLMNVRRLSPDVQLDFLRAMSQG